MTLEVRERDYDVRIREGAAYLGLLHILAALNGDERLVRSLETVCDDGVYARLEGVIAVFIGAVEVVERVFAPADIEGVAVREEGLAAQLLHIVADDPRPVRTQVRKVARLAEVYLHGDELSGKVDVFKPGRLHETLELQKQTLPVGAHIGKIDFGFCHVFSSLKGFVQY